MPEQFAIRMSDELARSLDELVASGRFETRAEAVRAAVEQLVDEAPSRGRKNSSFTDTPTSHRPRLR